MPNMPLCEHNIDPRVCDACGVELEWPHLIDGDPETRLRVAAIWAVGDGRTLLASACTDGADEIERLRLMGLHGPRPEVTERAAKSIAVALGYDASDWSDFILHAQAAIIGACDPDNRFGDVEADRKHRGKR